MISDNNTNNPQDEKNKLLFQSSPNVSEIGNKEQKECSNTSEKPPNYKTKNSFMERHWTKFCYQYYAPKNLFYSYNRYNDAD